MNIAAVIQWVDCITCANFPRTTNMMEVSRNSCESDNTHIESMCARKRAPDTLSCGFIHRNSVKFYRIAENRTFSWLYRNSWKYDNIHIGQQGRASHTLFSHTLFLHTLFLHTLFWHSLVLPKRTSYFTEFLREISCLTEFLKTGWLTECSKK